MAAVAAAVAVAAAADFVAEMWSYARSSCSGGTPIPFRLPCKVRHFLRRAVAAAADDESMPQSRRGLLAVANGPRNREWRSESRFVFLVAHGQEIARHQAGYDSLPPGDREASGRL